MVLERFDSAPPYVVTIREDEKLLKASEGIEVEKVRPKKYDYVADIIERVETENRNVWFSSFVNIERSSVIRKMVKAIEGKPLKIIQTTKGSYLTIV